MSEEQNPTENSKLTCGEGSVSTDWTKAQNATMVNADEENANVENLMVNKDVPSWRDSYTQVIGALIIHLLVIQAGINMAFSAIMLPQLRESDTDFKITPAEESWIASLVTISLPIGSLLSGPLMDRYGRRNISLLICIPYTVSWIVIFWANSVAWLYAGRIIAGAAGGLSNVAIFYTSETAHPLWRPMLLSLNSVFVSFGILLTSILGVWLNWRTIAVIFAVMYSLIFCLITIVPETPHWFLSFGHGTDDTVRVERAEKSLRWFNRRDSAAGREFQRILAVCRLRKQDSPKEEETLSRKLANFKKPQVYKPMVILAILFLLQQQSGTYVIVFYAIDLFKSLGGHFGFINEYGAMVCLALIRLVMAVVASGLSRKIGRRPLCMASGLGMGLSMIAASVYMYISESEGTIFTLICVLAFACFSAIAWQVIPWALTGELLPTEMRAVGGGIMISFAYVMMFLVVKNFNPMMKLMEVKGVFCFYGIVSFASVGYVWKFLPETLGRTLTEIESSFK